jgi:hypothetical protein
MKHLLNGLTEKEKNSIREQHMGGMKVSTENFSRLINTKSGDIKPLVNEDYSDCESLIKRMNFFFNFYMDSISALPNEIEDTEKLYVEFESDLGLILDYATQMECESIEDLKFMYNEYLVEMSNKLGLQ